MLVNKFMVSRIHLSLVLLLLFCSFALQQSAFATPFGQGVFGANTPFGSQTSLSLSLSGDVNISLTPSGGTFVGNASGTVTVTSNDAVGYVLYVYSPTSTTMSRVGGGDSIPASGNGSPSSLSTNTWGYNTSGSTTNFVGMLTTPTIIKDADGPYTSGDGTTVTYGVLTDSHKTSGSYSVGVVYTAVPKLE